MKAKECLDLFIKRAKELELECILDIGAGEKAPHANAMRAAGLNVKTNDILMSDYQGFYNELDFFRKFDGIWASHVLEHQRNVGTFLDKIHWDLKEGGLLAITVPPRKEHIVGGHLTLWNAGLLLYNLILAGFDCSEASVATYHYNVSVVVQKKTILDMPELYYDDGDVDLLAKYFPTGMGAQQGFDGFVVCHNWHPKPTRAPMFQRSIREK